MAVIAAGAGLTASQRTSVAATYYWDPGNTNSTSGGGTGTWDLNTTANWYPGSGNDTVWTDNSTTGTNIANFGGTAGNVTLNGNLSAYGLIFNTTNYTLAGSNTLTLGAGAINAGNLTSGTITIGAGETVSLQGAESWSAGSGVTIADNGTLTRNIGSTVDFSTTGTFNGTGLLATVGTTVNGWATIGGTNWAISNGSNVAAIGSYYTTSTGGNTSGNYLTTANVDVTSAPTLSGAITVNSLRFNTAGNESLTLTGNNTISSGGILVTSNVGNHTSTITGGTLKGGNGTDLVIIQNNTSNGLTIGSIIANNSSATGLTKSGAGTLTLSNSGNSYTGVTTINAGTLSVSADTNLGAAPGSFVSNQLALNGGTLAPQGNVGFSGNRGITVGSGGGTILLNSGYSSSQTSIAPVTGSGNLTITGNGGLYTPNNWTISGSVTVSGGAILLSGSGDLGLTVPNGNLILNGGTLQAYYTSDVLTLTLGSGAGQMQITGGASGLGSNSSGVTPWTVNNNAAYQVIWGSQYFNPSSLVLANEEGGAASRASGVEFKNPIDLNGATRTVYTSGGLSGTTYGQIDGVISTSTGTAGLIKTGNGTLVLQGDNTYNGDTTISGGTLIIGSPANTSLPGTLGNGSYSGNITIATGALLSFRSNQANTLNGVISGGGNLFTGAAQVTLTGNNTFTGSTQVAGIYNGSGATLSVSSFNSVATNALLGTVHSASSNLGAPTTVANGTITLGQSISSNVTLVYTGPGETTDRTLAFASTAAARTTILDSSGTGLLKFTTTPTGGTLVNSLQLQGSGNGELVGGLPFQFLNFTKSGTGTWTLDSNVNTGNSSGTTTVSGGLLRINNGTLGSTGNVTVSGGAIGGNGTITGAVSLSSTGGIDLRDGTTGTLNLSSTAAFAAGSQLYFDIGSGNGTNDSIAVAGNATDASATTVNLNLVGTPTASTNTYKIISANGGLTSSNFTLAPSPNFAISGNVSHFGLTGNSTAEIVNIVSGAVTPTTAYWAGETTTNTSATGGNATSWNTTYSSDGISTNFTFDAAGAYNTFAAPGNTTTVYIGSNTAQNLSSMTLDAPFSIAGLVYTGNGTSNTAGSTLAAGSGGNLTLGTGGITVQAGSGSNTISAPVILGGNQSWINNSGSLLSVSGDITNNANLLTIAGSGNTTIGGNISGSGGVTVNASGAVVTLSGASNYTGNTTLTAGTLVANNATTPLGGSAAALKLNGGTLDLQTIGTAYNTTVGGGTTIQSDNASSGNGTNQTLGTLSIGAFQLNVAPGSNATGSTAAITFGNTTLTGAATFNVALNSTLKLGAISGSFGFTKQDAGTLIFTGNNTFGTGTAGLTLNAGLVQIGSGVTYSTGGSTGVLLTVNGGTLDVNGNQIQAGNFTGSGGTILNNASGTHVQFVIGGNNLGGGNFQGTIADNSTGNGTIALTKVGTATATISGANTYSGATTINSAGGTLILGNVNAIADSSSVSVASGTMLELNQSGTYVTAGNISIVGAGTGSNNPGALYFGSGGITTTVLNAPITLGGNATISSYGVTMNQALGGAIGGTGNLTIASQGGATNHSAVWTIGSAGNASTYTGNTSIVDVNSVFDVTVKLGVTNALPTTTSLNLTGGASLSVGVATYTTLDLNGFSQTLAGLTDTGGAQGNTSFTFGKRVINSSGNLATLTINDSGSDTYGTPGTRVLAGTIGGNTSAGVAANNLGLTKTGAGTLILGGANVYTGPTTISAGTLQAGVASVANVSGAFGNNSAVTLANVSGATLALNNFSTQIGSLNGGGTTGGNVTLGNATLTDVQTTASIFSGVISGTGGGLALNGSGGNLTLTGANLYSGPTTISAGTLQIGNGTTGTDNSTSGFTVASAAVLAFNQGNGTSVTPNITDNGTVIGAAASGTTTFNGVIGGNGTFVQLGNGTTVFGNGSQTAVEETYFGGTTVSAGTLALNSAFKNGDGQIRGNLTINTGGTLNAGANWALGYSGNYVNNIAINGGNLQFNGVTLGTGGTAAGNISMAGGTISAPGQTSSQGFDLYNQSGAYSPTFTIQNSGGNESTISANMNLRLNGGNTTTNSVTFNVAADSEPVELLVSGNIVENYVSGSQGTATATSLVKTGNGTMALTGVNSYSGGTTISAGTIRANSATSSLGTGAVTVNSGATLGGNGTVGNTANTVTIAAGGTITAGADASHNGILTSGSQVWSGNGTYLWKISGVGSTAGSQTGASGNITGGGGSGVEGSDWDLINVTSGTLNLSGLTAAGPFYLAPTGNITSGTSSYSWVIAQVAGNNNISLPTAGNYTVGQDLTNGGSGGAFVLNTSNLTDTNNPSLLPSEFSLEAVNFTGHEDLVLDYNGTPEPGAAILVLGGAVPMLIGRRRRKSKPHCHG